jgi:hypothetical protein
MIADVEKWIEVADVEKWIADRFPPFARVHVLSKSRHKSHAQGPGEVIAYFASGFVAVRFADGSGTVAPVDDVELCEGSCHG